jgi:hypothetical protein
VGPCWSNIPRPEVRTRDLWTAPRAGRNAVDLRKQIAVLSNDLESIERVIETLGYEGALPTKAARVSRVVLFYPGERRGGFGGV